MLSGRTKKIKWALSFAGVFLVASILGVVIFIATKSQNGFKTVKINNVEILVEIATSSQEKERGLCCRDSLPINHGMLFVYKSPGDYRFWMKYTHIPLDMYWLDSKRRIVHIQQNVQPKSFPKTFGSDEPAQYVLETSAGFAKKHNIKVGDTANFIKN